MAIDNFKNFAKATVSTGYDASATSVVLTAGHGALLPTAPFNAVWYDWTSYYDPADDPKKEIIRVTAVSTDTLTVTRAQEGTSASTKNDVGKTYRIASGITAKTLNTDILQTVYPVGCIYTSTASTNPNTLFGFGSWSAFGAGRVLVSLDSGDTSFDTVEETGGAKTHTLLTTEIPSHTHVENAPSSASSGALKFGIDTNASGAQDSGNITGATGGGGAHNNLQPYIVVYMFKRDS